MDTSFKNFLSELGRLIHDRSIISCVYPKLVALEAVNELTKLNSSLPGLISTSKEAVLNHLKENPYPAVVFVTEHLFDGSGLELIQTLTESNLDHRFILILTNNHTLNPAIFQKAYFSGVVCDHNIGGPTCVLAAALRAVNQNQQFIDPELNRVHPKKTNPPNVLSEREQEVLQLAADGMSNKEMGSELYIAPTTVRDHMQSIMRKLQVNSRTAAAVAGLKLGLLNQ